MTRRVKSKDFLVQAGSDVDLAKWPTSVTPAYKDEQRKRFLSRINQRDKNWKLSLADVGERKSLKAYQTAYEDCLRATSTADVPWYVVPADDKKNARLIISEIILDVFKDLHMTYPKPAPGHRRELQVLRKRLTT